MPVAPIVALEIGSSKIVALVGEMRDDGNIMITGMGERESAGVRKGEIADLENALVCARAALQAAEESGQVTIRQVHLALSGGHIESVVNRGSIPVMDPSGEISEDDVQQVMDVARAIHLPPESEILHTICQNFIIDDNEVVVRPEGLGGTKLAVDMLALYGRRNCFNNIVRVVRSVPMQVQDVAFSGLCAALAVLTPEQKEAGVVLIDLGGGTTDYVAYANNTLAAAGALGVGGDHVTADIALAFHISIQQAERLKREAGGAMVDFSARGRRIALAPEVGFQARSVSLNALQTVIHARIHELVTIIRGRLERAGVLPHIGAGVVLTGGGAHLKHVSDAAAKVFGLPCAIGLPRGISGLATATSGPEYATAVGLVRYGFKTRGQAGGASPLRWVRKFLSRTPPTAQDHDTQE
jgi:cell division protein FtsA